MNILKQQIGSTLNRIKKRRIITRVVLILGTYLLIFIGFFGIVGQTLPPGLDRLAPRHNTQTSIDPKLDAELDAEFQTRAQAITAQLAAENLEELDQWWRSRQIPDPHKYVLPVLLAKLAQTKPDDRQPLWDYWLKLDTEQPDLYHFRSLFDARIFFEFQDKMPAAVKQRYQSMFQAPRQAEWNEGGTENHISQQFYSGLALADGGDFALENPHIAAIQEAWLRSQVTKFLTIGQGEFNSSTYNGFTIGALLNLYDFAKTPELRDLARAALDWLASQAALRHSWGTSGGAESRGFDRQTWNSGLSAIAWVWWGHDNLDEPNPTTANKSGNSSDNPSETQTTRIAAGLDKNRRLALLAARSRYRPPEILRAIALKSSPDRFNAGQPLTAHITHPRYYSFAAQPFAWETFHATPDFSLSTLVLPGRDYQTAGTINGQYATYKLVIRDRSGQANTVASLGGIYHNPQAEGRTPGERYLQSDATVLYQLNLTDQDRQAGVPAESRLVLPWRVGEPRTLGDWRVWQIGEVWFCARPWGDRVVWQAVPPESSKSPKSPEWGALVAIGDRTAWVTEVLPVANFPTWDAIRRALDSTQTDDSQRHTGILQYRNVAGHSLSLHDRPENELPEATINKQSVDWFNWPVLTSEIFHQDRDRATLTVEHNGDVWRLISTPLRPQW